MSGSVRHGERGPGPPSSAWLSSCLSPSRSNKMPSDGRLEQHMIALHGTCGWKAEVRVPADSVLDEGLLPGGQLPSRRVLPAQRGSSGVSSSSAGPLIPSRGLHPSDSSAPNHLPKTPSPDPIPLGLELQRVHLGEPGTRPMTASAAMHHPRTQ